MKFKLRTLLAAPAVLLMLSSTGIGAAASGSTIHESGSDHGTNITIVNDAPKAQAQLQDEAGGNYGTDAPAKPYKAGKTKAPENKRVLPIKSNKIKRYGRSVTGGAKAKKAVTVSSVQQLRSVLHKAGNKPMIVLVKGHLNGNYSPEQHKTLNANDYAKGTGYNFNKYLKDYNPKTYGKKEPAGAQENARKTAQRRQEKQISVDVPSNTTIVGENGSTVKNVNLKPQGRNIIVQNLYMQAPVDYFPGWDPQDGKSGNWNSQYDAVSLRGSKDVWLDHMTYTDGNNKDHEPTKKTFGRQYQQHDGMTDITNGADYVMVSNSKYLNHDKTILIGSSDNKTNDKGKLHVSLIHNTFRNNVQRTPRVRFGHVDMEDNYYENDNKSPYKYGYVWGYGKDAVITGNHNTLYTHSKDAVKNFVKGRQGKSIHAAYTDINGTEYTISSKGSKVNFSRVKNDGVHVNHKTDGATLSLNGSISVPKEVASSKSGRIQRIRVRNGRVRIRNARIRNRKGHHRAQKKAKDSDSESRTDK